MRCPLEVSEDVDSKQLKSIHLVYYHATKSQMLGRILGDGADHHRLGFPAIDIMVHIMLSGLLSKLINK